MPTQKSKAPRKVLRIGDNLYHMRSMNDNSIDLIYLDPPFNSGRQHVHPLDINHKTLSTASFDDVWTLNDIRISEHMIMKKKHPDLHEVISSLCFNGNSWVAYLSYMGVRLIEMHRILKPTGSIYLHCDPTMSHPLKLVMDCIFGKRNFRNEVVWHYTTGGASKRYYAKKHDVLLFYSKSGKYYFNPESARIPRTPEVLRRIRSGTKNATRAQNETKLPMDVFTDISALNAMDKERTGYPTQKPIELLSRIISVSSKPGDTVLDPFCGCSAALLAAEQLDRMWVGIDISTYAGDILTEQLKKFNLHREVVKTRTPRWRTYNSSSLTKKELREYSFKRQDGYCNGCGIKKSIETMTLDHIHPKSQGGGLNTENAQLLCYHCNQLKDDNDMAYLYAKFAARARAHARMPTRTRKGQDTLSFLSPEIEEFMQKIIARKTTFRKRG